MEEKEPDDEDGWYPRYDLQLKPGTTYGDLQSLKPLLDQAAEFDVGADSGYVPDMGAAYVMEVHPRQVDLVRMHSTVDFLRCMGIWSRATKAHNDLGTRRTYWDGVGRNWSRLPLMSTRMTTHHRRNLPRILRNQRLFITR